MQEGCIQAWLSPVPKAGSWPPGLHIFWGCLPKGLPSRLKKRDTSCFSSPPRCACCAMKYKLSVICTEKHGRGGEGFWCRGNRRIWSNAVLRALEQMTNIGHKSPKEGLAMVSTAKRGEIFLAAPQSFNLIWRVLSQFLLSLLCSCPKSQTGCFQPPQWIKPSLFCLGCAWKDLGWRSLGKTQPKPPSLSPAEAKPFLTLFWKVSPWGCPPHTIRFSSSEDFVLVFSFFGGEGILLTISCHPHHF